MGIRVIGHRGASAYEPENTLRSFLRAAELGADLVELDVHLSADGVPVVIHDARLERSTSGRGLVRQRTWAELREFDAGQGEHIPSLPEVLEALRGRCGLYIELKAPGAPAAVAEALRRARPREEVVCGSFEAGLACDARPGAGGAGCPAGGRGCGRPRGRHAGCGCPLAARLLGKGRAPAAAPAEDRAAPPVLP